MREVFMLREVEGLSTTETAQALSVSEDVVKTRLSRGRAALSPASLRAYRRNGFGSLPILSASVHRVVDYVLARIAGERP